MHSLLRFFSFGKHSVKHASTLLAVTAILSNVLGLARNLVFNRFNSPADLDIYYNSFRVADFLFNFLIVGAITAAVIPALSALVSAKEEERARETTNELISWAIVIFGLLGVVLAAAMPGILHLLFPKYDADPAHHTQIILLSRLLLIQPLLFAVSYIIGALLNGYHRFSSYSIAPLIYNVSLIVGGLLSGRFGIGAIIASVIIGAFLHLAIQTREVLAAGFRFSFRLSVSKPLREMAGKMLQPSLAQGFGQVVLTLYASLASHSLVTGSYSVYTQINNLQTTPTVVVATSLAAASFPGIVGAITAGSWERLNQMMGKLIRTTLFVLIPTVALSLVLRAQVVRLYIGIGHHVSWQLTDAGIATFSIFMLGVIPASLTIILTRLFYAHKDTKTPMLIAVTGGVVAIVVSFIGIHTLHWDVSTLALAETLSSLTQCVLSLVILYRRRHIRLPLAQLAGHTGSYLVGSMLLAAAAWASLQGMDVLYTHTGILGTASILGLVIQAAVASLVGGLAYLAYSSLMSKEELAWTAPKVFARNR